ncbi:hypothetical protein ACJRW5_18520 [Pseudomonas sp. SH1-B]
MPTTHLLLSLPNTESCRRVLHLLHHQADQCQIIETPGDCRHKPLCRWLQRLPEGSLGDVHAGLEDAIDVLERSRHSFKSAQLADLRKRLSQLLEELSALNNCGKN